jgi:hypothetical protein
MDIDIFNKKKFVLKVKTLLPGGETIRDKKDSFVFRTVQKWIGGVDEAHETARKRKIF